MSTKSLSAALCSECGAIHEPYEKGCPLVRAGAKGVSVPLLLRCDAPAPRKNRRIGGISSFHSRLENAARRLTTNAEEVKEIHGVKSYFVSDLDVAALRQVLDDKPAAYQNADLEEGRRILFSAIREAMPPVRADACIEAIGALVEAEVDTALESHGVRVP